ncbi:radical SAM protein, partial [Candidatus Bathyarchaeota archaeon]|nr:radical SAM protein [Candidatus Bathyarchaeota archaeon]
MIKMPWNNTTCPNVMIEITDACNLNCRVCYKKKGDSFKSLSSIKLDIEAAIKLRKLHTVTISGGEPTLHPELYQIVKMIKSYGFHVFLLTNGVLIDEVCIKNLKEAGLDSILFHVDIGQNRSDLPNGPDFNDIKLRLKKLTQLASSYQLDVSISLTLYDNNKDLLEYSKFFFDSEEITFFFIARGVDPKSLFSQFSDSEEKNKLRVVDDTGKKGIQNVIEFYQNNYGIEPFSYIPGLNGKDTVWISYFVPITYSKHGNRLFKIKSNIIDAWLMEIPRIISGKYIHKTKQNTMITLLRTFFNSVATFRPFYFLQFLFSLTSADAQLRHKMIVYDNGPIIDDKGQLVYCEYCPTAIVRNGKLLTCCTADYGFSGKLEKRLEIIEQTNAFCNICESTHKAEIIRRDNYVIAIVYCPKGKYEYEISSNADMFLEFRKRSFTDISGETAENLRYILNYIPITTVCNFNCTICGANAKSEKNAATFLSVDEVCRRVAQVKKNGGYLINLTGGEPTLHPNLLEIIKRVSKMGINIGLNTNG